MTVIESLKVVFEHPFRHGLLGIGLKMRGVLLGKRERMQVVSLLEHPGHGGRNRSHVGVNLVGIPGNHGSQLEN